MKSFLPILLASSSLIAFAPDDGLGGASTAAEGNPSLISFLDEEIEKVAANSNLLAAVKSAYDLLVSKFTALTGELQTQSASGNRTDIIDVTNKMTALLAATDTQTLALKAIAGTSVDATQLPAVPSETPPQTQETTTSSSGVGQASSESFNTNFSSSGDAASQDASQQSTDQSSSSD